ncbi:Translation initiation factor IF-3 [Candidatus Karelsulcia muelleri]|uniref:translation initiation factor IF-3 n=1 Tax=Candidatus Karelsulcia muelleri TaxID=336810 RepID=UPI001FF5DCE7|nr:translation initiation factor IF-3 [Candidatus Karelsulcia muelleri]UOQ27720.1 Translation initiation factor IF-3 [Candidatus Karelsulcia muelleri]UOQ38146.1 Translation initiation factor IF-3 [Candidatus Karelsulcia muelleri]
MRIKKKIKYKINSEIRSKVVRLVGKNIKPKVYPLKQALKIAKDLSLDLVEINPKVTPTICKAMNFSKFLYNLKKMKKKYKKNVILTKEIRLTSQTNIHDLSFKIENAKKILKSNNKVKFYIFFKGKGIFYKYLGEKMLLKCIELLSNITKVEIPPRIEEKKMFIVLIPKVSHTNTTTTKVQKLN